MKTQLLVEKTKERYKRVYGMGTCVFEVSFTEEQIGSPVDKLPGTLCVYDSENNTVVAVDEDFFKTLDELKDDRMAVLLENYMVVCRETDNEYLKELKRTDAGIAKEKDNDDKQKALDRYKNATTTYEEKKEFINKAKDPKELEAISVEIE